MPQPQLDDLPDHLLTDILTLACEPLRASAVLPAEDALRVWGNYSSVSQRQPPTYYQWYITYESLRYHKRLLVHQTILYLGCRAGSRGSAAPVGQLRVSQAT